MCNNLLICDILQEWQFPFKHQKHEKEPEYRQLELEMLALIAHPQPTHGKQQEFVHIGTLCHYRKLHSI